MRGFTFLELMLVISVMAVGLLLIAPAFEQLRLENRAAQKVNELVNALQYARNQAVLYNQEVKFCPTDNQHTCSGTWADGQIIMHEQDVVLRYLPPLDTGENLHWHGGFGRGAAVIFSAFGALTSGAGQFEYYFSKKNTPRYAIIINDMGRVRVALLR
jgi:type IV fimbrial biogenesis protein FimT